MSVGEPVPASQSFSYYPAIPPPGALTVRRSIPHACSYFPERSCEVRHAVVDRLPGGAYQRFLDAGYRRSGRLIYQPVCRGCRKCIPIRVPVDTFAPSKSQRRSEKRNADLHISVGAPALTDEKFALYCAYLEGWHDRGTGDSKKPEPTIDGLRGFLYESPVETIEFCYRDIAGRLLAVGICDVCDLDSLSSVYFYFDPSESPRSLGTFGAMVEIASARDLKLKYYYLGYWIDGCVTMQYKSMYRPYELLGGDGVWRAGGAGLSVE